MGVVSDSPLGKSVDYVGQYDSHLLCSISREHQRRVLQDCPWSSGYDEWTAYEVSWLGPSGKPCIAVARCEIPAESPFLIESKSFKLYLNSFNDTVFESREAVQSVLVCDLARAAGAPVQVELYSVDDVPLPGAWPGVCLDGGVLSGCDTEVNPLVLSCGTDRVRECVYSHLFKSNCLVTGQPDWGSVWIAYEGALISHESLLRYLVSYRHHRGFHEQCVERIYRDIWVHCRPISLVVCARYTRRGGLDINPVRCSVSGDSRSLPGRLARQ